MLYAMYTADRHAFTQIRLKETNMEEKSGFGYFLLGLGIGAAVGILWAPRAGEETRQLIADKAGEGADYLKSRAQEGTEYVKQRTGDLKQSATDLYERGRDTVARQKDTLNQAVEAGKQAYRDAVSDAKSAAAGTSGGAQTSGPAADRA
jgi:gas vesicle protein